MLRWPGAKKGSKLESKVICLIRTSQTDRVPAKADTKICHLFSTSGTVNFNPTLVQRGCFSRNYTESEWGCTMADGTLACRLVLQIA